MWTLTISGELAHITEEKGQNITSKSEGSRDKK